MPAFRSQLEVSVARELDERGVSWEYERPVRLENGLSPRYLPDFTINAANASLKLSKWVECKPQNFLYALRDLLGVTRTHGDRFSGEVVCENISSEHLKSLFVEELWKPKRLAELTGESVLVVGTVGAISSLSIEMRKTAICFSRCHPFVNWLGIEKAKERERRRQQNEIEAAERRRQWEIEQQQRQRMYEEMRQRSLIEALSVGHLGATKYRQRCCGCGEWVMPGSGSLRKVQFTNGAHEWRVICSTCLHQDH